MTKTAGSVGEGTHGLVRYDTIREDGGSILLRNIGVSTYSVVVQITVEAFFVSVKTQISY